MSEWTETEHYIMARVKLSAIFTSIAGRFGGGVFRNWKGTTVLSALPSSVDNPGTIYQEKARDILAYISKRWGQISTNARSNWRTVADYLTEQWQGVGNPVGARTLIYPPRGPFTGLGAMTSAAGLLGSVDEWTPEDADPTAPVGVTPPSLPVLGTISGDTAGLIIPWTDPATWGTNGTLGTVRVFVKSEDGTFHTQLAAFEAGGTETTTITALRPRGGGPPTALREGYYIVQLDAVNAEGLRSAPSAIGDFRVEPAV